MKSIGFVLIGVGIIMMLVTGFNVVTKKKVIDIGKIEISRDENHPVQWSPIIGGVLLAGGIVLLLTSKNK